MEKKGLAIHPTILATLLFALLTLLMTYPLAEHLSSAVVGWVGDNFMYVWMIGWFQKALFQLHQSPLIVPFLNYPAGFNLAYTDIPFSMILIGLPFSLFGTPTLGYNLSILISFVLSGVGVYLWVRRLTGNSTASIIAGAIFAFAPYRMSHLFGHLNLMGTQWFPFFFMGLSDLLGKQDRSWKSIALACVSLALIGLTSQYYLVMTLILTAVYLLGYLLFNPTARRQSEFWKRLAVFAVIALPLVLLCTAPYLLLTGQDSLKHSFEEVRVWSASPTDFILPSPRHFMWGDWIDNHFDRRLWVENSLYLGIFSIIFSIIALLRGKKVSEDHAIIKNLALTGGIAFLLALGTDLHWLNQPLTVGVPQFIQRWYPRPQIPIPLPGYFLFRYLPFYGGMRVWMRYGIFVLLFVSVLAGIGIAWLLSRVKSRQRLPLAIMILLLVLVDFFAGAQPLSPVRNRPVDVWLSAQSPGAIAQLPFWQNRLSSLAYDTLMLNKPIIGEPFQTFNTPQDKMIQQFLETFPDQASMDFLRELGVRWVVVSARDYDNFAVVRAQIEALGLQFRVEIEGQYVFELE